LDDISQESDKIYLFLIFDESDEEKEKRE